VNADADMNLLGSSFPSVMSFELALNLLRALHSMDHGREVYEEGIPHGFDDCVVV
jgi:hypothetical protein